MRKGKFLLIPFVITLLACLLLAACGDVSRVFFTAGKNIQINVGDEVFLDFGHEPASATLTGVKLTSSDSAVVEVLPGGYIKGVASGSADVTLTAGKASAQIRVNVTAPTAEAGNIFMGNADLSVHEYLLAETDQRGGRVYAAAKKGGVLAGEAAAQILPNGRVYIPLSALLKQGTGGVYEFGLAFIGAEGVIKSAALTDASASYSLASGEDWTFYNAESAADGRLSIVNKSINHGGASVTLSVKTDGAGKMLNPYIYVGARSGNIWSVKLRRGAGIDDLYEHEVLSDIAVGNQSMCTVDLTKYPSYVAGGKVTLLIYTVEGTLEIEDIIQYASENTYSAFVKKSAYVALESVSLTLPEKLRVGSSYNITVKFTPSDASFKEYTLAASSDAVLVESNRKIKAVSAAGTVLRALGYDGTEYGRAEINTTVPPESISFFNNPGSKLLPLSAGSFDLSALVRVGPESATDKEVRYKIEEDGGTGALVSDTGVVSFIAAGTIRIKVTSKDVSSATAYFDLYIEDGPVIYAGGITLEKSGGGALPGELKAGDSLTVSAALSPAGATMSGLVWKSSDERVLSVTQAGVVTAAGAGNASVYCYSADGAAYAAHSITVKAEKTISINPAGSGYAVLELSDALLSGDAVTVTVTRGDGEAYSFLYTVAEAEADVNNLGSMLAQRRILINLSGGFFTAAGEYTFGVYAEREGAPLNGYGIAAVTPYKVNADISAAAGWRAEYQAGAAAGTNGGITVTQTGGGFGYVEKTVTKEQAAGARYLIVHAPGKTADKLAVKLKFPDTEIDLTGGDCTGLGVYIFDLSAGGVSGSISSAQQFGVCLYSIGENSSHISFTDIFFASIL